MATQNPEFGKYVVEKILSRLSVLASYKSVSHTQTQDVKSENRGEQLFGGHVNL